MSDADPPVLLRGAGRLPLAGLMLAALLAGTGWTPAPPMGVQRGFHTATPLLDGRVLVAGGEDGQQDLASAELFEPSANTFQPAPSMFAARRFAAATALANGDLLVTGGTGGQPMMPKILSAGHHRARALCVE